jgi:hypothetical protein
VKVGVVDLNHGMCGAVDDQLQFTALTGGHVWEGGAVAVEPTSALERLVEDPPSDGNVYLLSATAEIEPRQVVVQDPYLLPHRYRVGRLGVVDLGLIGMVTQNDGFHPSGDPTVLRDINQWPDKGHEFVGCPGNRLKSCTPRAAKARYLINQPNLLKGVYRPGDVMP